MSEFFITFTEYQGPDKEARIAKIYELLYTWAITEASSEPVEEDKSEG